MTDLTLSNLTAELMRLSRALNDTQAELVKAEDEAARARHRADLAEAKAYLVAAGPVDARKREALIAAEDQILDAEVTEAAVRGIRSHLRVLFTRIDCGRTLISSARAEMQNFGGAT